MPNPYGQEDAQNILDKPKKPVIPLPSAFNASAQLGKQSQFLTSADLLKKYGDISDIMAYGGMTPTSSEAQANPLVINKPWAQGGINPNKFAQLPEAEPRLALPTPMMAGENLAPEDYNNTVFPDWLQGFMDKYGFRAEIDSRFPSGVDEETAFNYLFEKYGFMFPEMTDWLRGDDGGGEDQGYAGGYEIPLPDYSWGGGGYGRDKGYGDSGLVNWRI
jgi:hypothetical protein